MQKSGGPKRPTLQVYQMAGTKQIMRVRKNEANILVAIGKAEWRGRDQRAITALISVAALCAFVALMRFRPRPEATGIDSRTHKRLPGGHSYRHIRNEAYSPEGRTWQ
jgi:hypothetical protein